jgi:prepilin-type N-terminal cleavage/methylation domain-containing protein
MNPAMPRPLRQSGFTIVELIVTTAILGLMLFLVNQLFQDTSRAVTTSVQTSKTIAASRSINEQFTSDFEKMLGPGVSNDGGYIVIIQQRLNDQTMVDPQTLAPIDVDELRTDQIVFIRDAEGLKSMTPAGPNSYGTNFTGLAGDRAKVWYGHALRTLPSGDRIGTAADQQLGGERAGLDSVGINFILGRQAMLFNPTNVATNQTVFDLSGAVTHATNANYTSPVNNTGYTAVPRTYMGLTDMTRMSYGPDGLGGTMLTRLTNATDAGNPANDTVDYLNTAFITEPERLRVNTAPDADDTDFDSWAIAQGHAILAQSCSEIIIDFAADLDGDGEIDTDFGGQGAAGQPIWWYDALKDSRVGTTAAGQWRQQASLPQPYVNLANNARLNSRAFVFRVDDDRAYNDSAGGPQAHSYWPYLIRIRYRLHDTRGRLTSNDPLALRDGLDNDGDGVTDAINGDTDEDRLSGRWFERIISVPRP